MEEEKDFYRRGSGLKVIICHESDEKARYFTEFNRHAGNEVLKDAKGRLYVLVCKYDLCLRS